MPRSHCNPLDWRVTTITAAWSLQSALHCMRRAEHGDICDMEHDMPQRCHRDATEMPQRCHKDAAGADPFTWDFAAERVTERAGEVLGGRLSCPSGPSTSLNNNLNDWQHELLVAEGWGFQHSCFKYFLSLSSRLVQQHSGGVSSLSRRWSCWSAWIPQEVPSV